MFQCSFVCESAAFGKNNVRIAEKQCCSATAGFRGLGVSGLTDQIAKELGPFQLVGWQHRFLGKGMRRPHFAEKQRVCSEKGGGNSVN